MRIGIRTIKTAVGVSISVLLAQWLQLQYFASAGILTLLSIQQTRKQSVRTVTDRLFACLVGLATAGICFSLSNFSVWVFPIIYLLTIPLCVWLKVQGGISSSSVVILHTYIHQHVDMQFLLNELGIIVIGLGTGLLMNMYMPGIDKRIRTYKQEIDQTIATIIAHFAKHLQEGNMTWDGKEMLQLEDSLKEARKLARMDVENHLTRRDHHYYNYIENKFAQLRILQRMLPLISRIDIQLEQGARIGRLMEELSEDIRHKRDTDSYMQRLSEIRKYHKSLPLPVTREEFESRAYLYNLADELALLIEKINEWKGKDDEA